MLQQLKIWGLFPGLYVPFCSCMLFQYLDECNINMPEPTRFSSLPCQITMSLTWMCLNFARTMSPDTYNLAKSKAWESQALTMFSSLSQTKFCQPRMINRIEEHVTISKLCYTFAHIFYVWRSCGYFHVALLVSNPCRPKPPSLLRECNISNCSSV